MSNATVTLKDNASGKTVDMPIYTPTHGDPVVDIGALNKEFGYFTYDPGFVSTASCKSAITYLDGDKGELLYRGHPIEQLAEQCTHLEVSYLLLNGELPNSQQLADWKNDVTHHTFIHDENIKKFMDGFHHDAHPMGMLIATIGAMSTFYPEAKDIFDPASRDKQILRLIAKTPTLAAMAYRFSVGLPFVYPNNDLSFPANFLNMMWKVGEYEVDPRLERAMDVLFILHADHEQNCGTTAMRVVGSSQADPYTSAAAAASALYGPLHGGANEAVVRMLTEIGSIDNVPAFIDEVKSGKSVKLMGFGHRVYKNYDPRAKLMQETCNEVLAELGLENDPLFKLAKELEKIALEDDYFVQRKLYPNVDFYSGIVQRAIGIPVNLFTGIFALARTVGWIAQLNEMLADPDQKIGRPRQLFTGAPRRDVQPLSQR